MLEIGVDLVEVDRFRKHIYMKNKSFYEKNFTPKEIDYCLSYGEPAQHFAGTFAGKEAVFKALNRLFEVKLSQIEIVRDKEIPKVNILDNSNNKLKETNRLLSVKISLSHTSSYVIAFAIATFNSRSEDF